MDRQRLVGKNPLRCTDAMYAARRSAGTVVEEGALIVFAGTLVACGAGAEPVSIPHATRPAMHDAAAAYPLAIDPLIWVEQAKLVASDGASGDRRAAESAVA